LEFPDQNTGEEEAETIHKCIHDVVLDRNPIFSAFCSKCAFFNETLINK